MEVGGLGWCSSDPSWSVLALWLCKKPLNFTKISFCQLCTVLSVLPNQPHPSCHGNHRRGCLAGLHSRSELHSETNSLMDTETQSPSTGLVWGSGFQGAKPLPLTWFTFPRCLLGACPVPVMLSLGLCKGRYICLLELPPKYWRLGGLSNKNASSLFFFFFF